MTDPDRIWMVERKVSWTWWSTPYLSFGVGRYWGLSYGFGPFHGSMGYVQLF